MFPTLSIGPLSIQTPGLILLIGLWVGLEFSERHAPKFNASPEKTVNLVLVGLLAGLVGARLAYALQTPQAFAGRWLQLFSLSPFMLDLEGGLLAFLLAGIIYASRNGLTWRPTLDSLVSFFASIQVAVALANAASGDGFGTVTTLPWAIELFGARRHPTQFYDLAAGLVILAAVWPGRPGLRWVPGEGGRFWFFLSLSAGTRLFLEAFRADSWLLPGGVRGAQLAAWLVLALSLVMIGRLRSRAAQSLLAAKEDGGQLFQG